MPRGAGAVGPHPVDQYVGRRVAERRISLGYNQSDLGRALGLTFQQIQKYEKGANRISSSKLWDAAKFLDVEISYFFEGLAESRAKSADQHPITRNSLEIARMAPQLSSHHQKLALDLIKQLAMSDDSEG